MPKWVTIDDVADAAYAAGYRGEALAIAIAVTKPESGTGAPAGKWADAEALGDLTIQDATWGPSVGAWQVRTLKAAAAGTDRHRGTLFGNLARQAKAAYAISGGNTTTGSGPPNRGWNHWSVYKSGAHRPYLDAARKAAAAREALGGSGSVAGGGSDWWRPSVGNGNDSSLPATAAARAGEGARTPDVIIAAGELPVALVAPRSPSGIRVRGSAESLAFGENLLGGSVELTAEESSELTLDLANPGRMFLGGGRGTTTLRGEVYWGTDLRFIIAAQELTGGGEDVGTYETGRVTITARDKVIDRLKRTNVDQAGRAVRAEEPAGVKNLSPTQYAELLAFLSGVRFMGEGSPTRADIAPQRGADGIYEAPWEVLNRLARELGFWCFHSNGVLYFGRPSWLAEHAVAVKVGFTRNAWGDPWLDIVGLDSFRDTVDSFTGGELSFSLPRQRGELVRPGMKVVTAGIYGLGYPEWLVTTVRWPIDAGAGPVEVSCVAPVDPIIQKSTGPEGNTDSDTPTSSSPTSGSRENTAGNPGQPGGRIGTTERRRLFGEPGDRSRTRTVRTPWGISVTVNDAVESRFSRACRLANERSSWRPRRIDSYAVRPVRGSSDWSLHAFGLAWDFFSSAPGVPPPGGVWAETSAPDAAFRQAFYEVGFHLGANFTTRKDYPHIEWASPPPAYGS
jgi:hypothetical protein